ncbi:hypothetical protein HORIV_65660 [Vreelandella olivaria]|uniref:TRAP C4-dicarboxylate transport system permease DctM subunit domain-containing protein n=1 Tax=Vreelandella olivaria TaxID=390919 RepID=A0ABN5X4U8_9GAMM|nr:hypothetical protein HORIV_65660 [Halomonas olivaria]
MTGLEIGTIAVVLMLVLIYLGMHISIALMLVSLISIATLRNSELATRMVAAAANDSLSSYLYGVVPLFVLMGLLVVVSGVGRDTFDVFQWLLRKIRGGLGIATVGANGILPLSLALAWRQQRYSLKWPCLKCGAMGTQPSFQWAWWRAVRFWVC